MLFWFLCLNHYSRCCMLRRADAWSSYWWDVTGRIGMLDCNPLTPSLRLPVIGWFETNHISHRLVLLLMGPWSHQKWEERLMVVMGQKGWRREVHMLSAAPMYF